MFKLPIWSKDALVKKIKDIYALQPEGNHGIHECLTNSLGDVSHGENFNSN